MPVRYIESIGSEYSMGVLQGRLLKDSVAQAWQIIQESKHMNHVRPKLAPKSLHLIHCQKKALTFLKNYMSTFNPEQTDRVLGLANGAHLNQEAIFFLQAFEMELQTKVDTFAVSSGTAFAVAPEKSSSDEPILAKNLNASLDLSENLIIRKSRPHQGYASIELTYSFLAGTYSGMNEHGLTIVQTPSYATDMLSLKTVPLAILIQEALQTCKTTQEAISLLTEKHHRDKGGNLLIMDAQLDLQVLEVSRTRHAVYSPQSPFTVITNHFITSEMQKYQLPLDAKWSPKAMPGFAGQPILAASQSQYQHVTRLLHQSPSRLDCDRIKGILADHGESVEATNRLCHHQGPLNTQASIVFFPASRKVCVAAGHPCEETFFTHVL